MPNRPRRSVLFVPGGNARALELAATVPVDTVILDLEDGVPPEGKEEARRIVSRTVSDDRFGNRELVVRVNGLDSPWAAGDIALAVSLGVDGILVPKISRAQDIRRVRAAFTAASAPATLAIWAMIETPIAILNIGAVATSALEAGPTFTAMVIGTNDLIAETGIRPVKSRAPMLAWLTLCVAAAKSADLAVIDGPFNNFRDAAGFRSECEQGRAFGMDGKSLIHPDQIDIANEVFAPSPDEVAWAHRIVDAFSKSENLGKTAIGLDGVMVERVHERHARLILEREAVIRGHEAGSGGR